MELLIGSNTADTTLLTVSVIPEIILEMMSERVSSVITLISAKVHSQHRMTKRTRAQATGEV